ncbi:hypothetical protein T4B_5617 [Trichinella pseudospiralis]|uniref:Uncharacterized protein n=2 Tax=Trichinella pseudospiralis TaxID=6337 RepID=A0A0V1J7X5_TRIPS|nr:hypothetical protein T4A_12390 [Trichinella pseudospiralis]KRY93478.1 hypothetical protein T4D_14061 [Trichinella pseudospiralis]KRZ31090.1 hypothetical protein T4B_5617 [Trichinella pseudospiralis]KRZ43325.1 hypothetical protein T4C_6109 [Trichinella pseudospiralis]
MLVVNIQHLICLVNDRFQLHYKRENDDLASVYVHGRGNNNTLRFVVYLSRDAQDPLYDSGACIK